MIARSADLLVRQTGVTVPEWNERVRSSGADRDEDELRAWLTQQDVTGYAQHLLVMERFGYPDFLITNAAELIDAQYADREQLRPTLDKILAATESFGDGWIQARKGYVSLFTPRRTFAIIRPSTKKRVDLGLRLPDRDPSGRLEAAKRLGNEAINIRVGLRSVDDVDEEVLELLKTAYAGSS
jgi:Domain of unknown function (DUF5655)